MKHKALVIVESPAKSATISRYLGKDYLVSSSMGHVRDLNPNVLSIDVNNNYRPHYEELKDKRRIITELKRLSRESEMILLGPDPDREGEAIAFHLKEILKEENQKIFRILFNEITKESITAAVKQPMELDIRKVHSQQMRRLLDRLAGYKISPVLQKKIGGPLSAGRVQSIALKIIVEREKEIQAFQPKEYWTIAVELKGSKPPAFTVKLEQKAGKKLAVPDQKAADDVIADLEVGQYLLHNVKKRVKARKPSPPFITSSLQQEAFRRYKYPVKKTMKIAQELYEGVDLGKGDLSGLISYMRTDSFRIAETVRHSAREFILQTFGEKYYPQKPNTYATKKKIQDAHEAIRPTLPFRPPQECKPFLNDAQYKIYQLVWDRFFASQMKAAEIQETIFEVRNGPYGLFVRGEVILFEGQFKILKYEESSARLPDLESRETLEKLNLVPKQNFTKPPSRFTEASLVKVLEDRGIGRPSTYAKIIDTLGKRDYVSREDRKFVPTLLGIKVVDYLEDNFTDIMNYNFTAELEKQLDRVSEGTLEWVEGIDSFYQKLQKDLAQVKQRDGVNLVIGKKCPACGKDLLKKYSYKTKGWFVGCSGYPGCKYTERSGAGSESENRDQILDENCPKCGKPLVKRFSPKTRLSFVGCTGFPECNYIRNEDLGECPQCHHPLVRRFSRKTRRSFIGCSNYPECTYIQKK